MYSLPSYWDYFAKEKMGNWCTLYYFSHCCTCFVLFSPANPLKISSLWQDERNEMMKLSIWVRQVSTQQQLLDLLNSYGFCLTKASFTALPFLFLHFHFLSYFSLGKQPTFRDATNSFRAKWRLRNERRNSILMTCHHPDLISWKFASTNQKH